MTIRAGESHGDGRRFALVTAAITVLLLVAASAAGLTATGGLPSGSPPRISWPVLAVLFGLSELFVLHVQIRREAHTISLSEIPFVLGLLFAAPSEFLVARLLGPLVVFMAYRRQAAVKTAFNVALQAAGAATGYLVHEVVRADARFPEPRALVAVFAAVLVAALLETAALEFVVAAYERVFDRRAVLAEVAIYPPIALSIACFAVVAAYALQRDGRSAVFLGACAVVLVVLYRAFAALQERHLGLERLYDFSQAVNGSASADLALRRILEQLRAVAKADTAEVVLTGSGDELGRAAVLEVLTRVSLEEGRLQRAELPVDALPAVVRTTVLHRGEPLLVRRGSRDTVARSLSAANIRDGVWVPLRGEPGVVGLIGVINREGEVRGFDRADQLLLETVAAHTAIALQNGRLIDQLRFEASHDVLTGLPNRAFLHSAMQQAIADQASGHRIGIMIMDLDGFKEVNETLGHEQGDVLLQHVADRLRVAAPPSTVVARLGGDEFAILVPDAFDAVHVAQLGRRLLATLEQPVRLLEVDVAVSASIGVALMPDHARDIAGLLKRADVAMYAAKSTESDLCVYEAKDDRRSPQRLALVGDLRRALLDGDVVVHAQPKVTLSDGRLEGVEALARWWHARLGAVPPDDFIALAERSGQIAELTRQVLDQSLLAVREWAVDGLQLTVAVNISPRSLLDKDLVSVVRARLERHAVPPEAVTLEITEGCVMADPPRTIATLHALHDLGVRLSIDDFGTGYSSLSYLKRLPVHEVKIDKSFVSTMDSDRQNASIVRSVIDLGNDLGMRVVAEGVETAAVLARLEQLGCDVAQGFFVAPPMPLADVARWARAYGGRAVVRSMPVIDLTVPREPPGSRAGPVSREAPGSRDDAAVSDDEAGQAQESDGTGGAARAASPQAFREPRREPVLPLQTQDDTDTGWGELPVDGDELERYRRDRPPHHGE